MGTESGPTEGDGVVLRSAPCSAGALNSDELTWVCGGAPGGRAPLPDAGYLWALVI